MSTLVTSFPGLQPLTEFLVPEDIAAPLDWGKVFGIAPEAVDNARLEIEVGSGNARFLTRTAPQNPGTLYLGLERNLAYARQARDRVKKYGIPNIRILRADATHFLASHVADETIDAMHVYFTDPWPKKRHAKRRLFQTPFFETMHRILKPGAPVYVKIDLFWYFEEILGRFEQTPHFEVEANGMETDLRPRAEITGFEQKALEVKGAIYFLTARRT